MKLNMRYFVSICLCHQPSRFRNVVTYLFLQQYAQFHSVCLIFHCQLRRRLSGTKHFSSQRQQNFTVPGKHLLLLKISLQIIFPLHKNRSTMDTFLLKKLNLWGWKMKKKMMIMHFASLWIFCIVMIVSSLNGIECHYCKKKELFSYTCIS